MVIGSKAIKYYYPDFPREPKDMDIVLTTPSDWIKTEGVDFLYNPIILKYQDKGYLKPELMLSLKVSHMFWDINWEKHMFDIQFLLKKGLIIDIALVKELKCFWEEYLPVVRRSNLNNSKEDFFTNAVNKSTHEHDYLHTLINPIPTYTKILKDKCEVEVDESKWNNLTFEDKCNVVYEETEVMAYERYKNISYKIAYRKQLKDNIIKHFPLFIALFAIENYVILEKARNDYVKKISTRLMEKKTGKEIIAILKEYFGDNVTQYTERKYDNESLGLGKITEVDSYGGEGKGEDWYTVNHFEDHDVYIRTDGVYSSYHGVDFDEIGYEVKPKVKTIIVYEAETSENNLFHL